MARCHAAVVLVVYVQHGLQRRHHHHLHACNPPVQAHHHESMAPAEPPARTPPSHARHPQEDDGDDGSDAGGEGGGEEDGGEEEDAVERKIKEELYPQFQEAKARWQEQVRAGRAWSAPPLSSPRPDVQRARVEERVRTAGTAEGGWRRCGGVVYDSGPWCGLGWRACFRFHGGAW